MTRTGLIEKAVILRWWVKLRTRGRSHSHDHASVISHATKKMKTKMGVILQLYCHGKSTLIYDHANTIITTLLKEINILINKCYI